VSHLKYLLPSACLCRFLDGLLNPRASREGRNEGSAGIVGSPDLRHQ
jgi:hypothetical protein